MSSCILLLVKYPEPGSVKQRLARKIGQELVAGLYRNFVLDCVRTLDDCGTPFLICYHPEHELDKFHDWLGTRYAYIPQRGKDLGERLKNGFMDAFSKGMEKTVIMASDSPDLPVSIVKESCESLESNDAVIGPTFDGGYYLIGFRKSSYLRSAFEGITWSTGTVFEETIGKLNSAGLKTHILPEWGDVDTYEDLLALAKRGTNPDFRNSNTMRFIQNHKEIING